jgi:hypothetical protein
VGRVGDDIKSTLLVRNKADETDRVREHDAVN